VSFEFGLSGDARFFAAEFSVKDSADIKRIEKQTNHDVKAVEYFLRAKVSIQTHDAWCFVLRPEI
jgi:adenylosuccinate lyase